VVVVVVTPTGTVVVVLVVGAGSSSSAGTSSAAIRCVLLSSGTPHAVSARRHARDTSATDATMRPVLPGT
jgi:hypothetical protein